MLRTALPIALCALGLLACPTGTAPQTGAKDAGSTPPTAQDARDEPTGELVYTSRAGLKLTRADLKAADTLLEVQPYEKDVPSEARDLYKQGQDAGKARRFDEALQHFIDASLIARSWPAPAYGAGWTYLFKGDIEKSIEAYQRADTLDPRGYLSAKIALDTLQREQKGVLRPATYMRFELQMANRDPAGRIAFLKEILEEQPAFPAAWKDLSTLLENPDEALRAIEEGLKHKPDRETLGHLLINKAILIERLGRRDEAIEILGELALDPNSTRATEFMAKKTLRRFFDEDAP